MSGKKWVLRPQVNAKAVTKLSEAININSILSTLLIQRDVKTYEEAKSFFRPTLNMLNNPFLMKDMDKAVERLEKAIAQKEKILIYGDYDVDGTTAVALVYGFLKAYHTNIDFYIPDRYKEGYGISKQGINWAKENDISLIIALDCGIKSIDKVQYAHDFGIDFIICDHHLPGKTIPNAIAVLDPKREDCKYPFKELSGCGIGFKFMQAFAEKNMVDIERLYEFLDLTVLSIAADIVPIVGENRVLAFYGLQRINSSPNEGIKALIKVSGYNTKENFLNIRNLVFTIGPRINAAGRIHHAKKAVELLLSKNKSEAEQFANIINKVNEDRRDLDSTVTQEALEMIAKESKYAKSTVLFKKDWHKGVAGIVASRCIEIYYRPTIILSEDKGIVTGSARSVTGFDLHSAIEQCGDLLEQYGGHTHAAGVTLKPENLKEFKIRFEKIVSDTIEKDQLIPQIKVDIKMSLKRINHKFYNLLKQFAPFGPQNMRPVFVTENLSVEHLKLLKEKHLKFYVREEGKNVSFPAIAFGMANTFYKKLQDADKINLCYVIEQNNFQGKSTLQLRVKDIKIMA